MSSHSWSFHVIALYLYKIFKSMLHLQEGATLQSGKYKIEEVLGQGGFGITYLAVQYPLKKKVAIKEFFIHDLCFRDDTASVRTLTQSDMVDRYRQKFFKEAQMIAQLNHPNIVRVIDFFKENSTGYYVMDYLEGESLAEIIAKKGPLSESTALRYIKKVADALDYIHQSNVNHLDIKPANIMIRRDNDEPVIIDFGVSKQYDEQKDQATTTPPGVSNGYSPIEQYESGGVSKFSPQADIYSLGATLYKLLTGETPPKASHLLNEGLPPLPSHVSPQVSMAIKRAMQPRRNDRPKSIRELMSMLSADDSEKTDLSSSESERLRTRVKKQEGRVAYSHEKKRPFPYLWLVIPLVGFLLGGLGMYFLVQNNSPEGNDVNQLVEVASGSKPAEEAREVKGNPVIDNLVKNMVWVEGGTFIMGDTTEEDVDGDELPLHQVTLSSYHIGRYEVTQEEWQAVMGYNPASFSGAKRPVEFVSWDDCQIFINKLNEKTGKQFRLPTEAEWEFAARGGNNSSHNNIYSGSDNLSSVAWHAGNSSSSTHTVGQKKANELGLYDMTGNLWEWCSDRYGSYDSYDQENPTGSSFGSQRVLRGGGWNGAGKNCRVSNRDSRDADYASDRLGLRLAL